jgi:hypothetical protein
MSGRVDTRTSKFRNMSGQDRATGSGSRDNAFRRFPGGPDCRNNDPRSSAGSVKWLEAPTAMHRVLHEKCMNTHSRDGSIVPWTLGRCSCSHSTGGNRSWCRHSNRCPSLRLPELGYRGSACGRTSGFEKSLLTPLDNEEHVFYSVGKRHIGGRASTCSFRRRAVSPLVSTCHPNKTGRGVRCMTWAVPLS